MSRRTPWVTVVGRGVVEAFAPVRADLAGGTLDLWPLYCFHRDSLTVNVALRCGVRLRVIANGAPAGCIVHAVAGRRPRTLAASRATTDLCAAVGFHFLPAGGVRVEVLDQPPVGSGLGGSSAFAVALARACLCLTGGRVPGRPLVAVLRDLEATVLGAPTGVQDYYPALLGGALAIHLPPGGERVERLGLRRGWLARRLVVVYSGITHASGLVNWEVYRARVEGDRRVAVSLDAVASAARRCREALLAGDEIGVGRAIAAEWRARRVLAPSVSPPEVDLLVRAGLAAGALAGKACGAGGGGSVLFWCPPRRRAGVARAALSACARAACLLGETAPPVRSVLS